MAAGGVAKNDGSLQPTEVTDRESDYEFIKKILSI